MYKSFYWDNVLLFFYLLQPNTEAEACERILIKPLILNRIQSFIPQASSSVYCISLIMIFCELKGRLQLSSVELPERCRAGSRTLSAWKGLGLPVATREGLYLPTGSFSSFSVERIWRRAGSKSSCHPCQRRMKCADCVKLEWDVAVHKVVLCVLWASALVNFGVTFTSFIHEEEFSFYVLSDSWPWLWPLHTRDKLGLSAKFMTI